MRELELTFTGKGQVRGFKFTQIKKTQNGFIYKVEDFSRVYYEVFQRRQNNRFNCISYPSNKAFGLWAWTTKSIDRANDILNDIDLKEVSNV